MKIAEKMYRFHSVPRVEKFFCCMNRRLGCIIIGVIYIFFILEAFVSTISSPNLKCYLKGVVHQIVGSVAFIIWCITLVTTPLFLYGVTKDRPVYFLIFMYTTVLVIVFNMIHSCMMFFYCYRSVICPWPYLFGGANFIGAVVLIYFLAIVNSHYLRTFEKQNPLMAAAAEASRLSNLKASVVPSTTPSAPSVPSAAKAVKKSWFR